MRLPASHQILSLLFILSLFLTLFSSFFFFNQSAVTRYAHLFSLSLTPWAFFSLSFSHSFQSALCQSLALLQNPASSLHRYVGVLLWKNKGVFPLGRFDSIETNSGAIALLVRFIWVSVNTGVQILVRFDWGYVYTCSSVLLGLRSHWDWHKSSCLQIRPVMLY